MQSPIHSFIASLESKVSSVFPAAEVSFDGNNLSIYFKRSDTSGDFVMLLVDLTCMEEEDSGCVAVHARPDHIFKQHLIIENEGRTLILGNERRFTGGDWTDGDEFDDGHGNSMWMFMFPRDKEIISDLIAGLSEISADFFTV